MVCRNSERGLEVWFVKYLLDIIHPFGTIIPGWGHTLSSTAETRHGSVCLYNSMCDYLDLSPGYRVKQEKNKKSLHRRKERWILFALT